MKRRNIVKLLNEIEDHWANKHPLVYFLAELICFPICLGLFLTLIVLVAGS